ncbi:MAG TPA: methylenetetrahydrofolate reductase [NAD(P)H] [Negativicutes bacterium]|nr:methylenetetrahydrofolate reductase [NAD(P)H] [Negativicutes bacterium]
MSIRDQFSQKKCVVSCEIFPPKPDLPLETVFNTLDELKGIPLDYISVTYGAGGSDTTRSLEIAANIKNRYQMETLAHLTCIGASRAHISEIARKLQTQNIDNILALRGDIPADVTLDQAAKDYSFASDLIVHLKELGDFCIGAAAYPEGHIGCADVKTDLLNLKLKVEAGVDFLITQLFFDNDYFYRFSEQARALGINCPISVGIMPILNVRQIKRITDLCGARIPRQVQNMLDRYQGNPADVAAAGVDYACRQIEDLLSFGVAGIHLYTMNKAAYTKQIMENTGLMKR